MSQWKLSKAEYKVLLSYVGCGDFSKAKLLFFGNEEGLGGNELEANLVSRTTTYGAYNEEGLITSSLTIGNKENGFWEPDAEAGGDKVHSYLYKQGLVDNESREPFTDGFFLPMAARICLALESPNDENPCHWFQPKGMYTHECNGESTNHLDRYVINSLFQERTNGLQTALTDWRPLPRVTEKVRPEEYSLLDWNKYKNAFTNPFGKKNIQDEFTCYSDDAKQRALILQHLLRNSHIRVVIGFGDIPTKAKLIQNIFPGTTFESIPSKVFPTHKAQTATISLDGNSVFVILLPFPDPSTKTWNGIPKEDKYPLLLSYFCEMTNTYIKPKLSL